MMTVILVGYPGSQFLVPASKYLTSKYLPGFDVRYLNYTGPKDGWSAYIKEYLERLSDRLIIFALDDYLLSGPIDMRFVRPAMDRCSGRAACVKIHVSSIQEHIEYPVTTQYTIWDRKDLIWLLGQTTNPWDFEMNGSKIFAESSKLSVYGYACLPYHTSSSLSARWQGVRFDGLTPADVEEVKKLIV